MFLHSSNNFRRVNSLFWCFIFFSNLLNLFFQKTHTKSLARAPWFTHSLTGWRMMFFFFIIIIINESAMIINFFMLKHFTFNFFFYLSKIYNLLAPVNLCLSVGLSVPPFHAETKHLHLLLFDSMDSCSCSLKLLLSFLLLLFNKVFFIPIPNRIFGLVFVDSFFFL